MPPVNEDRRKADLARGRRVGTPGRVVTGDRWFRVPDIVQIRFTLLLLLLIMSRGRSIKRPADRARRKNQRFSSVEPPIGPIRDFFINLWNLFVRPDVDA